MPVLPSKYSSAFTEGRIHVSVHGGEDSPQRAQRNERDGNEKSRNAVEIDDPFRSHSRLSVSFAQSWPIGAAPLRSLLCNIRATDLRGNGYTNIHRNKDSRETCRTVLRIRLWRWHLRGEGRPVGLFGLQDRKWGPAWPDVLRLKCPHPTLSQREREIREREKDPHPTLSQREREIREREKDTHPALSQRERKVRERGKDTHPTLSQREREVRERGKDTHPTLSQRERKVREREKDPHPTPQRERERRERGGYGFGSPFQGRGSFRESCDWRGLHQDFRAKSIIGRDLGVIRGGLWRKSTRWAVPHC